MYSIQFPEKKSWELCYEISYVKSENVSAYYRWSKIMKISMRVMHKLTMAC